MTSALDHTEFDGCSRYTEVPPGVFIFRRYPYPLFAELTIANEGDASLAGLLLDQIEVPVHLPLPLPV
jgi:hypothetical protein